MTRASGAGVSPAHRVLDVIALAVLTLLAVAPLYAAFQTSDFWIAAGGGIVLGALIAAAGARWRWGALVVAAVTAAAYFAFGGALVLRGDAIAGVVPTLEVLSSLAVGVVQVWKQALTLPDPFIGFDQLGIAPYLLGLIGAVVGVSLALRVRRPAWALLPSALVLVVAIAFSTFAGFFPAAFGAAFAAVALGWVAWRSARERARAADAEPSDGAARSPAVASLIGAVAMVLVAASVGGATAAVATVTPRVVLRDDVVPPLELYDYASPLTSFRKLVGDGADSTLFTVTGLPAGARIRLAALDAYDGTVYRVSGAGGAGSGVFSRVGREIDDETVGTPARVSVEIGELTGVWLPTVGSLRRVGFTGADAQARDDALHYNTASSTAVVTTAVSSGDTYAFDAVVPAEPTAEDLANAEVAKITTPRPVLVPDALAAAADTIVAGASTPVEQVRAVEAYLQTEGFFSHGLEGQITSRAGHTVKRENDLFTGAQMIGDDEQYAVAMALLLSQLGIPVRVVMGFTVQGEGAVTVTGDDLRAWVEVPFEDYGWVSFWPTPSEDKVPQQLTPEQAQKPRVQVAQPPDIPQEPAELPPVPPLQESQERDLPQDWSWLWATLQIAGISLIVLAALLGPSAVFAVMRAARRRSRAAAATTAGRVHGGWAELLDAAADVGADVDRSATRREQAGALDALHPSAGVVALAQRADVAVFGAVDATPAEVAAYWDDVASATRRIVRATPWHRRLRARLLPVSVLRRRPSRRGRNAS